jgi:phosphatidylserine/phosphatidylglycerophosphate/cardiolipin synthase-like enzyme
MLYRRLRRGQEGINFFLLLVLAHFEWTEPALARDSTSKQQSLDEWRALTSTSAPPPFVFVRGDHARFYFQTDTEVVGFSAHWIPHRTPTKGYKVASARLQLNERLSHMPEGERSWRQATVIAGAEWRRLATNINAALAPATAGHAFYYQGFLADRLLYRDANGKPNFAAVGEQPSGVTIDRHFSIEETLQLVAQKVEEDLARNHPGDSLFVLLAPNARRFPQPLLLDRRRRQCIWLSPAALYDTTERGVAVATTAQGFSAFILESHGLALVKNPVSSAARLADLVAQTLLRFVRLPLPRHAFPASPAVPTQGMDLSQFEAWLDRYTGTRLEEGSIKLLIDGERFFPRLQQAIADATNHIHFDLYIFDKDDVAVGVADELKERSQQVEVHLVLDRMGCLSAGTVPPGTPLPEDFVPPSSIASYLRHDSNVHVHSFLNPWFSAEHSKLYLVDGQYAWLGGMNLGREYRYEWHDLMVELQGPVVDTLEHDFRRVWAHASLLGDLAYLGAVVTAPPSKTFAPATNSQPWVKLRLLPTKTAWKPFSAAVLEAINRSRNYIYVENSYLFDKGVVRALVEARSRGVDVRVIMPGVSDFKAAGRSNLVTANYLYQHGVRVFFYAGMTHVKAILVDDWAALGSSNFNHLSLRLCQEHNVATSDPIFGAQLKKDLFEEDMTHSSELSESISVDWMDFLSSLVLENF